MLTQNSHLLMWNRGITGRQIGVILMQKSGLIQFSNIRATTFVTGASVNSVGSQTFSKSYLGWVMGQAPVYAKSGSGAIITDIDGNDYIDYMMALLPVVLGHCRPVC